MKIDEQSKKTTEQIVYDLATLRKNKQAADKEFIKQLTNEWMEWRRAKEIDRAYEDIQWLMNRISELDV